MPVMSSLFYRMMDKSSRIDYVWLFAVGFLPIMIAWFLGLHVSYPAEEGTYIGYFDKHNFWPLAFVTPATLWLIRQIFNRVAPLHSSVLPRKPPAIINLLRTEVSKKIVYAEMRTWLSSPKVMGSVIVISLAIQVLDLRELVVVFITEGPIRQSELDWTVMYRLGFVDKAANMMLVVSAYIVQFLITFLGVFCVVFCISHNLFFLNRIYQRRKVAPGQEDNYISIDLDDLNKCFGFRIANDSFNTQVVALIIGGLVVLISRFASVQNIESEFRLDEMAQWSSKLGQATLFPDMGQVLLGIFWLVALGIISLPAMVKLLPRLPIGEKITDLTITEYLREFISPKDWIYGDNPTPREIDYVAAQFAANSFWPTGDNRASQLFFFSAWIFLIILFPVKTTDLGVLIVSLMILGLFAYGMKTLMFFLLNTSLSYVDERLVTPRPDLIAEMQNREVKVRSKVFISYRREDSAAYSRLLRQSLLEYMDESEIFMDIMTINDGQDFVSAIEEAVQKCEVMLVVIGKGWVAIKDEAGNKRLFNDNDFVSLEVSLAIRAERLVIPILVGDARMPAPEELPAALQQLWRLNARELGDSRWDYDVEMLAKSLAGRS